MPKPVSDVDMLCRAAALCDAQKRLGAEQEGVVGSHARLWELEACGGWGYRILDKHIKKKVIVLLTLSQPESSPSCGSDETGGGVGSGEDGWSSTYSGVEALAVG